MGFFFGILMVLITQSAWAGPKVIKKAPVTEVQQSSDAVAPAVGPTLNAKQAILVDLSTGEVLFEKNCDEAMAPSSMSKVLTTYLIFEALKSGQIKLNQTFPVSEKAWRKQGSKMFLALNSQVSVEDLLRGIIIQSGNDACIALAEGLAGSEEMFAQQLTKTAKELGAAHSNFVNATGWPDENHYSTARDLAIIAQKLIENFPEYYSFYAEPEFTYNNIRQPNRNPLLKSFPGADGIKTGSTDAGGFGLIGSAQQQGRRLIMVINGAESMKKRAIDSKALMTWGFTHFTSACLYKAYDPIDQAEVWLGDQPHVPLALEQDLNVTLPRQDLKNFTMTLVYQGPLKAPLKKGQPVGQLILSQPQKPDRILPVVVAQDIVQAPFFARLKSSFVYLFKGHP